MSPPKSRVDLRPVQRQWRLWQVGDGRAALLSSTEPVLAERPFRLLAGMRHDEATAGAQTVDSASAGRMLELAANKRPSDVVAVLPISRVKQSAQVLHRWEGAVLEVHPDHFVARVRETTDPSRPEERAEFDNEVVPRGDRKLLAIGAVFYWWLGYRRDADGTVTIFAEVRFRRLPQWTAREIARLEGASDLDAFFSE